MREIDLILTNNVNKGMISELENEIYQFDKNESNEEKLKEIVIDINKNKSESVILITNKEDLFEFFNRKIKSIKKIDYIQNIEGLVIKSMYNNKEEVEKEKGEININLNINLTYKTTLELKNIFLNNIKEVLFNYGDIFQIDIEKLVKGTTYNVSDKNNLSNLLLEDLNLINFKGIITSRLCVVFYRLTYFDLEASKASIGRFFASYFEKSESFKINLNRNPNGYFFTDLNNKIFRGYKIKPLKLEIPDSTFDLKIKIAKKLLKKKVKIEIVAEVLELSIDELNDKIYGTEENIKVSNQEWNKELKEFM